MLISAVFLCELDHGFEVFGFPHVGGASRSEDIPAAFAHSVDQPLAVVLHFLYRSDLKHRTGNIAFNAAMIPENLLCPENIRGIKTDSEFPSRKFTQIFQSG